MAYHVREPPQKKTPELATHWKSNFFNLLSFHHHPKHHKRIASLSKPYEVNFLSSRNVPKHDFKPVATNPARLAKMTAALAPVMMKLNSKSVSSPKKKTKKTCLIQKNWKYTEKWLFWFEMLFWFENKSQRKNEEQRKKTWKNTKNTEKMKKPELFRNFGILPNLIQKRQKNNKNRKKKEEKKKTKQIKNK